MEASERVASAEPTARPWTVNDKRATFEILADGVCIADFWSGGVGGTFASRPTAEANARLAVRAVNAHEALVASCREGRTALALAMQILQKHWLGDEFLDRAKESLLLAPGIGTRMQEAIAKAEEGR